MTNELGSIEVAVGPMFAGKSGWLVSKLLPHKYAKHIILAIRHKLDEERYNNDSITSHNQHLFPAKSAETVADVKKLAEESGLIKPNGKRRILGIDEVEFFEPDLVDFLIELQKVGVTIYITGLDLDFAGEKWETTAKILAIANRIEKLTAVCSICQELNGTRTQRLIDGKPASRSSPKVLVGGKDSYTARCILHHELAD